jgi:uncharacterized repeat protein (TIGR03803 family)
MALLSVVVSFAAANAPGATFTVLHSFGVLTNVSGFEPHTALVQDTGGILYGATFAGEGNSAGTVFKVKPDGTGFQVLMNFSTPLQSTNSTGANPNGDLVLSGNTLYGTTYNGGAGGCGTVFSMHTDGTGFTVLTNFPATVGLTNTVGARPAGTMVLSGSTLFGTTQAGGLKGNGTVFSVNLNGTGLIQIKSFSALTGLTNIDGAIPSGGLVVSGTTLYGATGKGGPGGTGTIFKVSTSGAFAVLTNFPPVVLDPSISTSTNSVGAHPSGGLYLSGNTLFGATSIGGVLGAGTVFSVNTSGSALGPLYTFSGGADGATPVGGVLISGNTLYGTTSAGGAGGFGSVYNFNTNNAAGTFTDLYEFSGDADGGYPSANLMLSGNTLYGSTGGVSSQPGEAGGNGTLFAVNTNGIGFTNIYSFGYSDIVQPLGGLAVSGNTLYGSAYLGGPGSDGGLFAINTDGSGYTIVSNFAALTFNPPGINATNGMGANPRGSLVMSGGMLYGAAYFGGGDDLGTVFSANPNGSGLSAMHSFTGGSDGSLPEGTLLASGNLLYGTASFGGANGNGTVFALNPANSNLTILKTFSAVTGSTNGDGANPNPGLVLANNVLYGTTLNGGTKGAGTAFSIDLGTTNFANLHNFTGGSDGGNPGIGLTAADGTLFGATHNGGTNNTGSIFVMATNGANFAVLKNFSALAIIPSTGIATNGDGANPAAALALVGNTLYGTTVNGGTNGFGTIFSLSTNGGDTNFTVLHYFDSTNGANPNGNLLVTGNVAYGTTFDGGTLGDGIVYSLTFAAPLIPIPINIQLSADGSSAILTWTNPAFSLQSAPAVTGTYTNVPGATSPYTTAIGAAQQYFRLEAN